MRIKPEDIKWTETIMVITELHHELHNNIG